MDPHLLGIRSKSLHMLLLLHAIIPCLHTQIVIPLCGSVNSELQTISFPAYISCVWSYRNHLFTVHHSDYYNLVSLIFGTTIPTSLNNFILHIYVKLIYLLKYSFINIIHFAVCTKLCATYVYKKIIKHAKIAHGNYPV